MNILMANKYFFIKGGAENSFFETAGLLERQGHKVSFFSMKHPRNKPSEYDQYFVSNVEYESKDPGNALRAAGRILYSFEARHKLEQLLQTEKPDLAHLNNIYHQISPSILHSLKKYRIPVVMTLRDYKVVCASYSMLAGGKICEACRGGKYYNCLLKSCVKRSRLKSLLNTAEMYLHHDVLKIYDLVDEFISPSRFLINKLHDMGFDREIQYLPNFTTLNDQQDPVYDTSGKNVVYFGRVSTEKGLNTLITAFKGMSELNLRIIGEGPLLENLQQRVVSENIGNVIFCGYRKGQELIDEIKKSLFIVLPSECYENNPRTIIEGFAMGKPTVGARIGGIPELVRDGETGWTFESGNVEDLREKLRRMASAPDEVRRMGKNGRMFVEAELNTQRHYKKLMEIYQLAIKK